MIELFEQNIRTNDRQSSKGNQLKWEKEGIWYKADYPGYVIDVKITSNSFNTKDTKYEGYVVIGGIAAYASAGEVKISDCKVAATGNFTRNVTKDKTNFTGAIVGQLDAWKNTGKDGFTTEGFTEWDATGSVTKLALTDVTVDGTVLEAKDNTKTTLFGTHQTAKFADRITITKTK